MDLENNGTQDSGEDTERLSMEELMEMGTGVQSLKEGEVVRGVVVAASNDEMMVDIGFKCEGTVPIHEVTDPESGEPTCAVGDEIEVYVEKIDAMEGRVHLSRSRAARLKIWTVLEDAYKNEESVTGSVIERVKGGLSVDIGIRAFLPGSLADLRPSRRLEDYIGQEIEARIISFDRRRSNVVLSRKALLEEEATKAKDETMSRLEEGQLVTGAVKNITDYGVFVELGGLDGLLHITDISWGRVGHPSEYFKLGDEIEVVILRFDRERERVSLGYKQRFEDPWILVPERYPVGKRVHGSVVSIVDYGAFVALEEGVEGLVHVSEMSWTKKIKNPRSVLEVGEEVDVVVSEVDIEKRRLSLSLRATEPNPWETVAETYQVGSRISGVVRNLTDFGAFVEIVPGVDGLVHISDMSWTRRINHPSEIMQKGAEVEAVVTAVDVVNQRISLSMKELLPNEWEEYANSHGVGDLITGSVTNITDFGVFIELSPGVEGLCHISEIDREPGFELADVFQPGQKVRCRILRIDWNESRIGLSMHGVSQDDAEEEHIASVQESAGADTAMAAALRAGGVVAEEEPEEDVADAAPVEDAAVEEPEDTADAAPVEEAAVEEPEDTADAASAEEAAVEEPEDTADAASAEKSADEDAEDAAVTPAEETSEAEESSVDKLVEDAIGVGSAEPEQAEEAAEPAADGEPAADEAAGDSDEEAQAEEADETEDKTDETGA